MAKLAISVTLQDDNLNWLRARLGAVGARSVSDLLDRIIADARKAAPSGAVRSVVGTVDIDSSDPLLTRADEALRGMFDVSLGRPMLVKEESRAVYGRGARKRRG